MSKHGYYNRLDRTPIEIAKLHISEIGNVSDGFVLVMKKSDGIQPTYDVRYYDKQQNIPKFFNGKIFDVKEGLVND